MNRSMPPAVIIPVLAYPNVREAVDWLCQRFGFSLDTAEQGNFDANRYHEREICQLLARVSSSGS